jgi:mRNA interferase MazF
VWLVDFGTPIGREQGFRRPAVVLSVDRFNTGRSGLVIVVPCTTAHRALPTHVQLESGPSGLRETSYAKAEDIKSVSIDRLARRLGAAPAEEVARLARIVALLLGI